MTARQMFALAALAIVGILIAVLVLGLRLFPAGPSPDERVAACYALIPADRQAGVSIEYNAEGTATVNLGGEMTSKTPTKDQLDSFLSCLQAFLPNARIGPVSQPAAPLGEVADHWSDPAQTGPKLRLLPGGSDMILNNLRFGPVAGTKAQALMGWCAALAACVTCEPQAPTEQTPEVLVGMKPGAPTKKVEMPGTWARPAKPKPWQIVDRKGRRYFYECTRKADQATP